MLYDIEGFRWRAHFRNLTYKGFIDSELLLAKLASISSVDPRVLGTSIVYEESDAEVPYDHTHLAWMWSKAPNLHGCALMAKQLAGGQRASSRAGERESTASARAVECCRRLRHSARHCGGWSRTPMPA